MSNSLEHNPLCTSIRQLIEESKQQLALAVNATMSMLYWRIGTKVNKELSQYSASESYGKQLVVTLCRQLETEYGTSVSEKNLRRMMQFAQVFPDEKIVVSLRRQLTWAHLIGAEYLTILPSQEVLKEKLHRAIAIATSKRLDND